MKRSHTAIVLLSLNVCLLLPGASMGISIISGNLSNIGTPGPEHIALDLMFFGTDGTYSSVSAYYAKKHHCPPANFFLKQPENKIDIIDKIYNDANCGVVGHFSSRAPGALQNQYIRLVPKKDSSGIFDFSFKQIITTIDFVSNGRNPDFLQKPLEQYRWSPTAQGSSFGNTASAALNHVLNDAYDLIAQEINAVNQSTPSTSNVGSTSTTNIVSV